MFVVGHLLCSVPDSNLQTVDMIIFANTDNFIFKNCAVVPVFLWLHHLVLFLWLQGVTMG